MVNMAGQQQKQYSARYRNLLITGKHETNERSTNETYSNPRIRRSQDNYRTSSFHPKTVYYNSNHRQQQQTQQYFTRQSHTSPRRQQTPYYNTYNHTDYHYPNQPIRPLMEIKDNLLTLNYKNNNNNNDEDEDDYDQVNDDDNDTPYRTFNYREPKQRGQYRNRKAELDWDHAFDLDLIDLYSTNVDIDAHSLISIISSSDHSFSSI